MISEVLRERFCQSIEQSDKGFNGLLGLTLELIALAE